MYVFATRTLRIHQGSFGNGLEPRRPRSVRPASEFSDTRRDAHDPSPLDAIRMLPRCGRGRIAVRFRADHLRTDLGPDSDDAGALAMLHTLETRGEADLMAVLCSTLSPWCAPAADAINTYFRRPNVPVGTLKRPGPVGTSDEWPGGSFNGYLAGRFENDLQHREYAEDAVALYRRLLAGADDSSVAIAATGPLTNLRYLLESPPTRSTAEAALLW